MLRAAAHRLLFSWLSKGKAAASQRFVLELGFLNPQKDPVTIEEEQQQPLHC